MATGDVANTMPGTRDVSRRRVWVQRHGLKEKNIPGRDNLALKLLPEGLEALACMRGYLEQRGALHFDFIRTSPYERCRQTAEAIAPVGARISLEPGLSEVLNSNHGLRLADGSSDVQVLSTKVQTLLDAAAADAVSRGEPAPASPLVRADELEADEEDTFSPRGTKIADGAYVPAMRRGERMAAAMRSPTGPLSGGGAVASGACGLLVTHGGTSFAIIDALLNGKAAERFDQRRMPEMGSMTEMEERASGQWEIVGSLLAISKDGGGHECRWVDGGLNTAFDGKDK